MSLVLHELSNAKDIRLSPYAWRSRMALVHKGLNFETVGHEFLDIKFIGDGSFKTVPVLDHDGKWVQESRQIAYFLDETYPEKPLMPGGANSKGMTELVYNYLFTQVHPLLTKVIVLDVRDGLSPDNLAYFNESRQARFGKPLEEIADHSDAQIERVRAALKPFEDTLSTCDYLGGSEPNFADYQLFGNLIWPRLTSDAAILDQDSAIYAWWQRCLDLHDGYARNYLASVDREG